MRNNIYLIILSLVFSLLVGEVFFRLNPELYCDGYRPSKNDKLVYELFPNHRMTLTGDVISPQGLNDIPYHVQRPNGLFRIAVVGDSTSFSLGIPRQYSFPKVLETSLRRKGYSVEIMNFSVPGYNTSQESELISSKVLQFDPNMVILVYCQNDIKMCNYFKPRLITSPSFIFHKSYFIHYIFLTLDKIYVKMNENGSAVQSAATIRKNYMIFKQKFLGVYYPEQRIYPFPGLEEVIYYGGDPPAELEKVPWQYWYMLEYGNYQRALSEIIDVLKGRGVTLISSGLFDQRALQINQSLGVRNIVSFYSLFGQKQVTSKDVEIPGDGHLNINGHRIVAEGLEQYILQRGLMGRGRMGRNSGD